MHLATLVVAATISVSPIEQVHTAWGKNVNEISAQWVTQTPAGVVTIQWGSHKDRMNESTTGNSREFIVDPGRTWYTHMATMVGLKTNTEYFYRVGDSVNGFSAVNSIMNRRLRKEGDPYRHIIMGDMGAACAFTICPACTQHSAVCDAKTCATNKTNVGLISETATADQVLHVGDFAYDLGSNNGTVGDQFFRNIEQIAAKVPYMISHGNHEDSEVNIAHFIERFRLMPSNALPVQYHTKNGASTNSLYFSWDHGLVHYVAMSTELWFGVTDFRTTLETFVEWVKKDLEAANKNRDAVPWIVVHGHRSIYCSCDSDCDAGAEWIRLTMEPILFDYGVDFFINGHEHNYERTWPTHDRKSDQSNMDPKATIYVVTGAAGSHEMHEPFTKPQPSWSAFRSNSFSYTRMMVYNASHIHWQQVQTDPTLFPLSDYGRVIDDTWIVQHNHGPFKKEDAPKTRPTSCPQCSEYDHWTPLLGLPEGTGKATWELIAEFRKTHGEQAWKTKLRSLMELVNSQKVEWEDVRRDGNSDGAWAQGYKWKGDHA